MNDVVDAFLHLLHDSEQCIRNSPGYCRSEGLVNFLRDFRLKRINPIHNRLQHVNGNRYVLSMVGLTNVGKSTLAHALLGHPVAPRRNGPATSIPVEYERGEVWLIKTCLLQSRSIQTDRFDSPRSLGQALERRVFDLPGEQASKIERLLVRGPMELLDGGLVFADTPGFGAAQPDDAQGSHQARLSAYVRKHIHEVLFCVSGADCTVKKEEVEFFETIRELCSTVVVTKWDSEPDMREREIQAYKSKFADLFPLCGFMFIEAKWALEGRANGTAGKLEASGIDELCALIRQRNSIAGRHATLRYQLNEAWEDLLELARDPLRESGHAAIPWRDDAILRLGGAAKRSGVSLRSLP